MPYEDMNHVEEVGMRDVNRYLDAGYTLLVISNYAKAVRRPDGAEYTRKGVHYVVGWNGLEPAPDLKEAASISST